MVGPFVVPRIGELLCLMGLIGTLIVMTMVRQYACMLSYKPGRVTHIVHDYVSDMFSFIE